MDAIVLHHLKYVDPMCNYAKNDYSIKLKRITNFELHFLCTFFKLKLIIILIDWIIGICNVVRVAFYDVKTRISYNYHL